MAGAGLILLLGEEVPLAAWRVVQGAAQRLAPGDPWPEVDGPITALLPPGPAPVWFVDPVWGSTAAQARTAARLAARERGWDSGSVVWADGEEPILILRAREAQVAAWQAQVVAALGREADDLVPAALALPVPPPGGACRAKVGERVLARTEAAAFAGEPALWGALVGPDMPVVEVGEAALCEGLAALHDAPPFAAFQGQAGPGAPWPLRRLGRLAALVAVLGLALPLGQVARWRWADSRVETATLAQVARRFPGVTDLVGAAAVVERETRQKQIGTTGWAPVTAALWQALRTQPGVRLAALSHEEDGTLRVSLAAPGIAPINAVLLDLQRQGWAMLQPPVPVQDGSETLAALTVQAP